MSEIMLSPGIRHEEFLAWAKQQGVFINGVRPAIISGHGLGIVAQRRIEVTRQLPSLDDPQTEYGDRLVKCFAMCLLPCF